MNRHSAKMPRRHFQHIGQRAAMEELETRRLLAAIGGLVYSDRNNNAVYDSSGPDIPYPGVTVFLDSNKNGQFDTGEPTAVTASYESGQGGEYQFNNVTVGQTYDVGVIPPTNFAQTYPLNNQEFSVAVTNPQLLYVRDFGVRDTTQYSRISGKVFGDTNGNGTRDASELYMSNVTVWADLNNNSVMDPDEPTTTTNSSGVFTLNPLNPNYSATYYIRAVAPTGLTQTTPASNGAYVVTIDAGNGTLASDVFGFADQTPPTVIQPTFLYENKPHTLEFDLSEPNTNGSWTVNFSLSVTRLNDNTQLQPGSFTVHNQVSSEPTWVLNTSVYPSGVLPDGNYRATIAANTFSDAAGNVQSNPYTFDFFVLSGDANHDGKINGDDYFAIDSHVNIAGASGYSNGDFNYDGKINGDDYFIIDSKIHQQGAPPAAVPQQPLAVERTDVIGQSRITSAVWPVSAVPDTSSQIDALLDIAAE